MRALIRDYVSKADYWAVWYCPAGGQGWKPVEGWDRLDEPTDRETFELNNPYPEPGTYQLFPMKDGTRRKRPARHKWTWKVEEEASTRRAPDSMERKLDKLIELLQPDETAGGSNTDDGFWREIINSPEDAVLVASLQSGWFERHGDPFIRRTWESRLDHGEVSKADFMEDPTGTIAWENRDLIRQTIGEARKLMGEDGPGEFLSDEAEAEDAAEDDFEPVEPEQSESTTFSLEDLEVEAPDTASLAKGLSDTDGDGDGDAEDELVDPAPAEPAETGGAAQAEGEAPPDAIAGESAPDGADRPDLDEGEGESVLTDEDIDRAVEGLE